MRTSTLAAIAASAFLNADPRAQGHPPDSEPAQGALKEQLPPTTLKATQASEWQKRFSVTDAFPDVEWVKARQAQMSSEASWETSGTCTALAGYLGVSAKAELMTILKDPKAPKAAFSAAAHALFATGDEQTITDLALIAIRSSTPVQYRFVILEIFGAAAEPRTVPLVKELLKTAGAATANAKDEAKREEVIHFACAVIAQLDQVVSLDARDGLFHLAQDVKLPLRMRAQAAAVLSGRDSLEARHYSFLERVCEGKEFDCPPEAAVIVATHLVYRHTPDQGGELLLRVLNKHMDSLPSEFPLNVVCLALEATGGPDSFAMLRRLASNPRLSNSFEAVDSLKRSGSGSQVDFLIEAAADGKLSIPIRSRAASHAVYAEMEQSNFDLPQARVEAYLTRVKDAALPPEVRAAFLNGLLNAHTLASERGLAAENAVPSQRELKFLDQVQAMGAFLPPEVFLARRVRLAVPGTVEQGVIAVRNQRSTPDMRSAVFRGLAAVQPERAAALLAELAQKENPQRFNFSPFLIAVERGDPTLFAPALELIAGRGAPRAAADQYKAIDLIALAAPQIAIDALTRLAEDAAVPFPARARALIALTFLDRPAAAPLAVKFAASPVWTLQEAGDIALASSGDATATARVVKRFEHMALSQNPVQPADVISIGSYARALASSGQVSAWKALDPYLSFNTTNRAPAVKLGIEEALRSAQSREAVLSGLRQYFVHSGRADAEQYAAALSRSERFGFHHPLRFEAASLVKIVEARENAAALEGSITVMFVSRGDSNGALYHLANIARQLHTQGTGNVLVYEVADEADLDAAAVDAARIKDGAVTRPVDNVLWAMHGSKIRGALEGGDPRSGVILDPRKEIDTADIMRLGRHRGFVRSGGLMLWIQCSAGEPGSEQYPQNMMKAGRAAFPEIRSEGSIAPEVPIKFKLIRFKFGPNGELLDMDTGGRKTQARLNSTDSLADSFA